MDVKALRLLLDEGIVPIIPPLGFDGEPYVSGELRRRCESAWPSYLAAKIIRGASDRFPRRSSSAFPCRERRSC